MKIKQLFFYLSVLDQTNAVIKHDTVKSKQANNNTKAQQTKKPTNVSTKKVQTRKVVKKAAAPVKSTIYKDQTNVVSKEQLDILIKESGVKMPEKIKNAFYELHDNNTRLVNEINRLNTLLNEANKVATSKGVSEEQYNKAVRERDSKIQDLQKQLELYKKNYEEVNNKFKSQAQNLVLYREQMKTLEERAQKNKNEIASLEQRNAMLEQKNAMLEQQKAELNKKMVSYLGQIVQLQQWIATYTNMPTQFKKS